VDDLIDESIGQRRAEGLADETLFRRRQILRWVAAFFRQRGRCKATAVTPQDIDAYMFSLAQRGLKVTTRRARADAVRAFFRWLTEGGKVLSNPARDIAVPGDDDEPLPMPPLSEQEVADLLGGLPRCNVLDLRHRFHLELLYGCGLRIAESVALDVHDLNLADRTVHIRAGKGRKERMLPLMTGVLAALLDYLALRRCLLKGPDTGVLLLTNRGTRLTEDSFRQWLARYARRTRRKLHPHLLRHSIAVHLLRGGADIRYIQQFLGHSSLDTTKVYLRLVPGRLKEQYEKSMPTINVKAAEIPS
jgi:site-specific recombinase XerD